ncbi:MAG: hypothetical protein JO315_16675 [Acidobacteria bacterium]|nr:hypothetical protein [Acidobacteriota bacterium]
MRHLLGILIAAAATTVVLAMGWSWFSRARRTRLALFSAGIACVLWVVAVGIWRNQHAAAFPAIYPTWFNFVLPALAAVPGAVIGVVILLAGRTGKARLNKRVHG